MNKLQEPVAFVYEHPDGAKRLYFYEDKVDNLIFSKYKELYADAEARNKPVMTVTCDERGIQGFSIHQQVPYGIHSLYIAPQYRELSDGEIIQIWGVESIWDDKLIKFARAILKKASEK